MYGPAYFQPGATVLPCPICYYVCIRGRLLVLVSGRVILIVSEREKREFSPGNVSSSRKSKIEKGRKTAAAVRWWGGDTTPPLSNNITHARNRRKRLASCFSPPPFWRESEC